MSKGKTGTTNRKQELGSLLRCHVTCQGCFTVYRTWMASLVRFDLELTSLWGDLAVTSTLISQLRELGLWGPRWLTVNRLTRPCVSHPPSQGQPGPAPPALSYQLSQDNLPWEMCQRWSAPACPRGGMAPLSFPPTLLSLLSGVLRPSSHRTEHCNIVGVWKIPLPLTLIQTGRTSVIRTAMDTGYKLVKDCLHWDCPAHTGRMSWGLGSEQQFVLSINHLRYLQASQPLLCWVLGMRGRWCLGKELLVAYLMPYVMYRLSYPGTSVAWKFPVFPHEEG